MAKRDYLSLSLCCISILVGSALGQPPVQGQPPPQQQQQQYQQQHQQQQQYQQQQYQQQPPQGQPVQQQQYQQPPPQGQPQYQQPPQQQQQHQQPGQPQYQQQPGHVNPNDPNQQAAPHKFADEKELHDQQHIKSHLEGQVNVNQQMTNEQLQFHYFKMHDTNNDNMLDGVELIKAITHWHGDDKLAPPKLSEQELQDMIDQILKDDDFNDDGFIDYTEFLKAQQGRT